MKNPDLLKTLPESDYPSEYLAARLLGKRGAFLCEWESLVTGSDVIESLRNTPFYEPLKNKGIPGIWLFLTNEHGWVYRRMNPVLRKSFAPYFIYQELNTLIPCLRYLSSEKENNRVRLVLHDSLLHEEIQLILTDGQGFAAKLQVLETRLCSHSASFQGLLSCYEHKGMAGLETFLRDRFFASILEQKLPVVLKIFFQNLIDFHNCMFLAKILRWQVETPPDLIPGGILPAERLQKAHFRKDITPVIRYLHFPDTSADSLDLRKLETALLSFITGKLKRLSYERTVIGDILFYLWEQYRYCRNISMIFKTVIFDDEPVLADIVS